MNTHDIELPEPSGHYYEWDGVYGNRKFTAAPHNGRGTIRPIDKTYQHHTLIRKIQLYRQ